MGLDVILAAVDFSAATVRVYEVVAELAERLKARVVLLNVSEPQVDLVGMAPPQAYASAQEEIQKLAEAKLHVAREQLEARGVIAMTEHEWGPVVACILDRVRKHEAGLLVVASHGHGVVYNLIVGSVAEGLLRHSPVPVVVVPAQPDAKAEKPKAAEGPLSA